MSRTDRIDPKLAFALVLCGTVLGIAGTDLVLPAVPGLPAALGGTPAAAQLVLAAFVAGAGVGLLLFGELGARFDQPRLLALSLFAYAAVSAGCGQAGSLDLLILLRFAQGAAGAAAAVFAPGFIRAGFEPEAGVRALGLLGSIESIVPALAPVAGLWLLHWWGWQGSFDAIAVLAFLLAVTIAALRDRFPKPARATRTGGYGVLLRDPVFLRYALSQAFTLGGLLTFVFGAPVVITVSMGGTLTHFIIMQISGILFFAVSANYAGKLAGRFGTERMILFGSTLSALGALGILVYALAGGNWPPMLAILFVPVNLGLGLRGPPGFMQAVIAAHGDDARGAALVILFILLAAAGGTAAAAPFILAGLPALAGFAAAISALSVLCLLALPKLQAASSSAETVSSIQPPPSTRSPW
ncbi:MAG TPA: MFS transporter [Allosphingosinicella sp.]|nr:MFS transporter [Allosphingosinicella sp.]